MESTGRPAVSIAFPEQYPEAARALGRAFINDPPLMAILPDVTDPVERARRLTIFFNGVLAMQRRNGQPVLGVPMDGKIVAAAIIEGAGEASTLGMLLAGLPQFPKMVQAMGWGGLWRSIQLLDVLARNHPREPQIYLNFLGVDPDYQRHHCGSALLEHLRELAAQRRSLCGVYLETATEANVAYYESHGYELLSEIYPLGVRMWRMLQRRN